MPSRNIVREFAEESYYHVYNRGVEKRDIFTDAQDYTVFLGLLKKYLTGERPKNDHLHQFKKFNDELELLCYCLMPNHFHLLFYQKTKTAVPDFMRRVMTGYVMYFNNRHSRVGGLFQSRYKSSLINKDEYLHHVSRYIHLNPKNYQAWPYSSLAYYQGRKQAKWISTTQLLSMFDSRQAYLDFVDDYQETKQELDLLKWQVANGFEL